MSKNLVLILILALGINLAGIRWGLPSQGLNSLYFTDKAAIEKRVEAIKEYPLEEAYKGMGVHLVDYPEEAKRKLPRSWYNPIRSYHPDEYFLIKSIAMMDPENFNFNPHQYTVGGAYLYLVAGFLFLLSKIGMISLTSDLGFYFLHPEEIAKFYLVGRAITALYGMGTVWLVYLMAKKIWQSERAGLLAGILTAISPLILLNSRYMYTDIPGLFWITAALYLTVSIFTGSGRVNTRHYFLIGLFAGLATGNKITFAVSFIIPVLAAFLKRKGFFVKTIISFAGFLVAFFITNPYFFFTFPEAVRELSQHGAFSFGPGFYILSLKYGLGWPLLAFTVSGIIFSFLGRKKKEAILIPVAWIIFFFLFISLFAKNFARYILPIVPPLIALGSGFWLLPGRTKFINTLKKTVTLLVLITTFFYGMAYLSLFIKENVRTTAGRQIKEDIPEGTTIGVTEVPWQFQMPPLDEERYRLKVTGYDINSLIEKKPDYFLLSSFQAGIPPVPKQMPPERRLFWKEFKALKEYQPYISFRQPLSFLGIKYRQDGASEDLIYLNPTIVIFRRKGAL